jgi:hypothetical protein
MWLVCLIAIRCICSAEISAAESRQALNPFENKHLELTRRYFKKNRR